MSSLEIATVGTLAARHAGLHYVRPDEPGLRRRRVGKGFVYLDVRGRRVRDPRTIARIRAIVIPPAWTEVWICTRADGHVQATGRDARGRKQYRYHGAWRNVRDEAKFAGLATFASALPDLRVRVAHDMRARGLPRHKVLAAVVRLLETTLIRVGNDEYARANASYGLTTLQDHHVKVRGAHVTFRFTGKSGITREVELQDRRLATIVAACRDVPGPGLFQYYEPSGRARAVASEDVNAYIREIAGRAFSAKCFRTWGGTVYAASQLVELGPASSEREAKRRVREAVVRTSDRLGNTPAVCRASYVHPTIFAAYADGSLDRAFAAHRDPEPAVLSLLCPARAVRRAA